MHVPYFQRTVNHKVCVLFLLSHINKTQRGKQMKKIFRQYYKISVEDDRYIYKLMGKIKIKLSLKSRRKNTQLCTEAKQ